ncbi:hypothetical protein DPMN_168553 [Dreissena polymorpha]|uniref:Uncharacterized protein n=1 Tax=Dreissena polymorpha TaxID=45954 RepID=A0A9D4IXC4_DREPO|nr:hypothetical protein DPMN_168553 [Dreissena polymorpha]
MEFQAKCYTGNILGCNSSLSHGGRSMMYHWSKLSLNISTSKQHNLPGWCEN